MYVSKVCYNLYLVLLMHVWFMFVVKFKHGNFFFLPLPDTQKHAYIWIKGIPNLVCEDPCLDRLQVKYICRLLFFGILTLPIFLRSYDKSMSATLFFFTMAFCKKICSKYRYLTVRCQGNGFYSLWNVFWKTFTFQREKISYKSSIFQETIEFPTWWIRIFLYFEWKERRRDALLISKQPHYGVLFQGILFHLLANLGKGFMNIQFRDKILISHLLAILNLIK